ncbi:type VII secretion target [Actinoplanes sp. NPDC024001]|uniref:type VII secretion target n=1 Tax=Actinoplanes sp. NPDC024001 TaxID=3154598 RepID=UPI0033FA1BCF
MADHQQQVRVRHTDLLAHAGAVEGISDQITAVARAGQAVRAGPEAFGRLCTIVPAALGVLQDLLVGGIRSAAAAMHDTGGRLRATAEAYESADHRRATAFHTVPGRR